MSDALKRALGQLPTGEHLDDGALAAYLDGALDASEREAAEKHLAACALCADDIKAAVRVEIEAEALDQVDQRRSRKVTALPRPATSSTRTWLRLAAGIVLVFGALLVARQATHLVAARLEPVLVAQLEDWTKRRVSTEGSAILVASGPGIELSGLQISDDPRFSDVDFVSAHRVALHVSPAALLGGRLQGSIELDRPLVRLVRNRLGQWNIETLGGGEPGGRSMKTVVRSEIDRALEEAARGLPPRGAAAEPQVELTSARIDDGILEIQDIGAEGRVLRVENVDLSYHGIPGQRATVSLEGRVGSTKDRIALRGEVGPFEGDVVPVYRFREVALEAVPVAEIPGAPAALVGQLTFDGHLESAGRALGEIVAAARGAGEMTVCCGTFEGRNLARDLVEKLAKLPGGEQALRAARQHAALAAILDAPNTVYDHLGGIADLEPGTLHLARLEVDTALFRVDADASIGLEGRLAADGSIELSPDIAGVLLAAAPALAALADAGSIHLPFRASGSWQDLQLDLDVEALIAKIESETPLLALFRYGPGRLAFPG